MISTGGDMEDKPSLSEFKIPGDSKAATRVNNWLNGEMRASSRLQAACHILKYQEYCGTKKVEQEQQTLNEYARFLLKDIDPVTQKPKVISDNTIAARLTTIAAYIKLRYKKRIKTKGLRRTSKANQTNPHNVYSAKQLLALFELLCDPTPGKKYTAKQQRDNLLATLGVQLQFDFAARAEDMATLRWENIEFLPNGQSRVRLLVGKTKGGLVIARNRATAMLK